MLLKQTLILAIVIIFSGCSNRSVGASAHHEELNHNALFAVMPFNNFTQTPLAGYRAATMAEAVMRNHGFRTYAMVAYRPKSDLLEDNKKLLSNALSEAKERQATYLIGGDITEWRYKTGIDGEPAVSFVVRIMDVQTKKIVYTSVASDSGWGASSIGVVVQNMLDEMLPRR